MIRRGWRFIGLALTNYWYLQLWLTIANLNLFIQAVQREALMWQIVGVMFVLIGYSIQWTLRQLMRAAHQRQREFEAFKRMWGDEER